MNYNTSCKLAVTRSRIIAFTIYGTQQQSRIYEKEGKQSSVTRDLWNEELGRASPQSISKV